MSKRQIITIAGKPGSGKSTTAKGITEQLGFSHFSSGDLFRTIAKERGIDLYQANLVAEQEKDIDHAVDQRLCDIYDDPQQDKLVIDSRMAWHWMPESFKVYLDLDTAVAAQRILAVTDHKRASAEHLPDSTTDYAKQLDARLRSEAKRYQDLYQVDPYDTTNYDLVIDTAKLGPQQTVELIAERFSSWLEA